MVRSAAPHQASDQSEAAPDTQQSTLSMATCEQLAYYSAAINALWASLSLISYVACVAALKNARLNGVKIRATTDDLIGQTLPEPFDVVLVGDLLYDEAIAGRLEAWLEDLAEGHGTEVYLGDPGRHGLTDKLRRKLTRMRTYRLPENVSKENHGYDEAVVWKFLPSKQR